MNKPKVTQAPEGLYSKYEIIKSDGSPVDPHADYFVMRLDTDEVARKAALYYSSITPNKELARDLVARIVKHQNKN